MGALTRAMGAVLLSASVPPASAVGQWKVGLEVGAERFSGTGRITSDRSVRFLPYRPFWWGGTVESPGAGLRWALGVSLSRPDLALESQELTVVGHERLTTVVSMAPIAVIRIARLTDGASLRGEAGPLVEHWAFDGDGRWRLGARIGVGLDVTLRGRVSGVIAGHLAVTPASPLEGTGLEGLEPEAAWRRGLRGSLRVGI
jgi:hypothetical protein